MFEIISILDNSVRVRSGIVIFDVKVEISGGKKRIIVPKAFYIHSDNYKKLVAAVLCAYDKSIEDIRSIENGKENPLQ